MDFKVTQLPKTKYFLLQLQNTMRILCITDKSEYLASFFQKGMGHALGLIYACEICVLTDSGRIFHFLLLLHGAYLIRYLWGLSVRPQLKDAVFWSSFCLLQPPYRTYRQQHPKQIATEKNHLLPKSHFS